MQRHLETQRGEQNRLGRTLLLVLVNYVCTTPAFSTARQHIIFEDKTPYHNIPQVVVQYRLTTILVGVSRHKSCDSNDLDQSQKYLLFLCVKLLTNGWNDDIILRDNNERHNKESKLMLNRIATIITTVIILEAALFAVMGLSFIIPELLKAAL